jgi:hypothetical protein
MEALERIETIHIQKGKRVYSVSWNHPPNVDNFRTSLLFKTSDIYRIVGSVRNFFLPTFPSDTYNISEVQAKWLE